MVRLFGRFLPRRVARPLGVVVATVLVIFLLNGVLFQGLVEAMNSAFSVKDAGTEEGAVEPTAPERSGSPASLVPWEDLGLHAVEQEDHQHQDAERSRHPSRQQSVEAAHQHAGHAADAPADPDEQGEDEHGHDHDADRGPARGPPGP